MNALVTGGSGYFGSLLIKRLIESNWNCKVLDINEFIGDEKVAFIKGDIRNSNIVSKACENIDVVFHNVAQVPLAKNKKLFNSVNIDGTINVMNSCLKNGVKKFIYTSSSAVYGIPESNPVSEDMQPYPLEDYGKAKYIAEKHCQDYINQGLNINIIRPRTILGHGRLGIFQILFEWIRSGNNIPVLGNGDNIYQFVHADDLANAIILSSNPKVKPGIYNCGADRFGTMRDTLEKLCEYAGTGSKVKSLPFKATVFGMKVSSFLGISPLGDYHSLMYGRSMYFDITKAKNELKWKPIHSNEEMFIDSYEWYLKNRDSILRETNIGSLHQSKVKQGALKLVKMFL